MTIAANKFLIATALIATALFATAQVRKWAGDDAIKRVEDCVCYAAVDGQNLKPWEVAWDNPDQLRRQVSHCVCRAHIDVSSVENPRKYLVPGTVLK